MPYMNSIKIAHINKMKEQLKHLLKKIPTLQRFASRGYASTRLRYRYMRYLTSGTKAMEMEWATRHLRECERERDDWGNGSNDWIKGYCDSLDHPHRSVLVETISRFNPSSILEVGCNCGPNLYLLAKRFPDAKIRGIDINPMAVHEGNKWFTQESIPNVRLSVGKADELDQFQDKSFDVVFTDAVLIYIGPDKIKGIMKNAIRITRQALIFMEWHSFKPQLKDPYGLGVYEQGNWKRDYVSLLKQFVPDKEIYVTKISEETWPDENWKRWGAVTEAIL